MGEGDPQSDRSSSSRRNAGGRPRNRDGGNSTIDRQATRGNTLMLSISPAVCMDIADAAMWYGERNEALAERFTREFQELVHKMGRNPRSFARWEPLELSDMEVRRCRFKNFPYYIGFECDGD